MRFTELRKKQVLFYLLHKINFAVGSHSDVPETVWFIDGMMLDTFEVYIFRLRV